MSRLWRWLKILLLAAVGLALLYVVFALVFIDFMVDMWWFDSLGFLGYFYMRLTYRYIILIVFSLLFFLVFWARAIAAAAPLLLALLAAPAGAQVPADRPIGVRDASAPGLAPFAGRRVTAIDVTGHKVTKDWVITREIRTKVGHPLDLEAVERDVARLDNLSIFAEIRVDGEPVGDDVVRLVFTFKEMPSWFPILSYVYTEENGFSWGLGISAGNLTGRDLSYSARVYFGDLEQQWSRISWPWIRGNRVSFDFYGEFIRERKRR